MIDIMNLLKTIILQTEPNLSDEKIKLKSERWLNEPCSHFNFQTPKHIIEKGQKRKVVGLLEQLSV